MQNEDRPSGKPKDLLIAAALGGTAGGIAALRSVESTVASQITASQNPEGLEISRALDVLSRSGPKGEAVMQTTLAGNLRSKLTSPAATLAAERRAGIAMALGDGGSVLGSAHAEARRTAKGRRWVETLAQSNKYGAELTLVEQCHALPGMGKGEAEALHVAAEGLCSRIIEDGRRAEHSLAALTARKIPMLEKIRMASLHLTPRDKSKSALVFGVVGSVAGLTAYWISSRLGPERPTLKGRSIDR